MDKNLTPHSPPEPPQDGRDREVRFRRYRSIPCRISEVPAADRDPRWMRRRLMQTPIWLAGKGLANEPARWNLRGATAGRPAVHRPGSRRFGAPIEPIRVSELHAAFHCGTATIGGRRSSAAKGGRQPVLPEAVKEIAAGRLAEAGADRVVRLGDCSRRGTVAVDRGRARPRQAGALLPQGSRRREAREKFWIARPREKAAAKFDRLTMRGIIDSVQVTLG